MRLIEFPAYINSGGTEYEIKEQILQDNVISALVGQTWSEDFTDRVGGGILIEDAVNWIKSKLVVINPFVITNKLYYVGDSSNINSYMRNAFEALNIEATSLFTTGDQPLRIKFMNGTETAVKRSSAYINSDGSFAINAYDYKNATGWVHTSLSEENAVNINLIYPFYPSSAITGDSISDTEDDFSILNIQILGKITTSFVISVHDINMNVNSVTSTYMKTYSIYGALIDIPYTDLDAEATGFSGDNPYEINPSTIGGGYGTGAITPSDLIDDPEAPDIDAISTGLLTIYKPTLSQVQSLGNYLWSSAFDVNSLKKLFGDPMEAIIGLSIVPVNPPGAGSKNVKIGDVDTGISMSYIGRQFVEKDLGSITIDPYIGSFMDYSPYTKIQIYLPYVGFRDLSPEDVMGCTLSIKYIIDVVSGGCNAIINVSGKGAIYQFNGSAIANIPLSAINYSGAIQNAVSAIGSGLTTVAGIATGNPAMGALGVAGLVSNAANTAVNSKPTIQHSGTMGGAAGLCSVQYPYCIIERPRLSTPANYNGFIGNTLNVTMNVGDCDGLTVVESIHLDNVLCTENERDELMQLLKEGVIIHVPAPEPTPTPESV